MTHFSTHAAWHFNLALLRQEPRQMKPRTRSYTNVIEQTPTWGFLFCFVSGRDTGNRTRTGFTPESWLEALQRRTPSNSPRLPISPYPA